MGRTVSIRFKNGKVDKVTGSKDPRVMESARRFGEAFVDPVSGAEFRKEVADDIDRRINEQKTQE
jgi:hypothetical protein